MTEGNFEEICDFNICEDEKEKELGEYKALFYSESKMEIPNPDLNNWQFGDHIEQELLRIMEKRKEQFENQEEYDYSIEVAINYQIRDKTSGQSSGDMVYKLIKNAKNKDEFKIAIEEISQDLDKTFREKVVIMYNYTIFGIDIFCGFYVK